MHFLLSLQVIIKYNRFQGQLIATPELYPCIAAILKKRKSKHCLQQKYADKEKKTSNNHRLGEMQARAMHDLFHGG